MSEKDKAPVSILTASAKIHYIAIFIFAIFAGIFYVVMYADYFNPIKKVIQKWTMMFSEKNKPSDMDMDMVDIDELGNEQNDEPDNNSASNVQEDVNQDIENPQNNYYNTIRGLLSPF